MYHHNELCRERFEDKAMRGINIDYIYLKSIIAVEIMWSTA